MTARKSPPRRPKVFAADDPGISVSSSATRSADPLNVGEDGAHEAAAMADNETASGSAQAGSPHDAHRPVDSEAPTTGRASSLVWSWGGILFAAVVSLMSLSLGLWFTNFVADALGRNDWVGKTALALAIIAAVALLVLVLRELIGLWRLSRLTGLRRDADAALANDDLKAAQRVTRRLKSMASRTRHTRWDLAEFREEERHKRTGSDLLGLADRVLLAPADRHARTIVYQSARRVAIVTALVPITFIVVLFVLMENLRMLRRLAGAYGGQPGFLGGLRLFWKIVFHLAATGAVALSDDLFGQFLGQDVAHRVSRRLGEGAFNGAMTARLGVAAITVMRPLPFIEAAPPRIRSILTQLFPEFNVTELVGGALGGKGAIKQEGFGKASSSGNAGGGEPEHRAER